MAQLLTPAASPKRQLLLLLALVIAIRLPFLNQPIQGDDNYYLTIAMHARIDPLHPTNFRMAAEGMEVDMRGFPHPPMNAWILAALLAVFGDVREIPFHAFYVLFSLIAIVSVWMLARRFSDSPFWTTAVFAATPAFVVNGNSLESDLPFLAFWLAACAIFVSAVDNNAKWLLPIAGAAAACAAMTAYQGVALAPILGLYLWNKRSRKIGEWAVLAAPFAAIAAWQLWMRLTTGAMPADVLAGYMSSSSLQSFEKKLNNALALTTHLGWVVFPALAWVFAAKYHRRWLAAASLALPAIMIDSHPLFWLSLATGLLTLVVIIRNLSGNADDFFLSGWVLLFFGACLAAFFAGSARYLLPLAAPAAIIFGRRLPRRLVITCFAAQMAVSLGLAAANYDQWNGYRQFVAGLKDQFKDRRVWINSEWGFRFYAEAEGALRLLPGQAVRPGDVVFTSQIPKPAPVTTGGGTLAPIAQREVRSPLPFRLMALESRSGWSLAADGRFRPFDLAETPIDLVRAETVVERIPTLEYLPMGATEVSYQVVSGVHEQEDRNAWRWTTGRVVVVLKAPARPSVAEASFNVHERMRGCRVAMSVDGAPVAEANYTATGMQTLRSSPLRLSSPSATIVLSVDRTFSAPGDRRVLGLILTGIGFRTP